MKFLENLWFKNTGRRVQILSVILAAVSFVALLALAVYFLVAGLRSVDATLRTAGIQGAVISLVGAVLCPALCLPLYGFGTLLLQSEKSAENDREVRELLRQALADGALSEDISRKLSQSLSKITVAAPQSNARPATPVRVTRPADAGQSDPAAPAVSPLQPMNGRETY